MPATANHTSAKTATTATSRSAIPRNPRTARTRAAHDRINNDILLIVALRPTTTDGLSSESCAVNPAESNM